MRVDAHVHVWPRGSAVDATSAVARAGVAESLLSTLAAAEVGAAVIVQPSVCGLDHSYLSKSLNTTKLRLVGIAQAEPDDPTSLGIIDQLTERATVVGFRLPLIRSRASWIEGEAKDYWALAELRQTIITLLVTPTQLDAVSSLASAHPSVPVVIDHLARFDLAPDRRDAITRLCDLSALRNVHVKLSALASLSHDPWPHADLLPTLVSVINAFGTDRVLWGSDYPFILEHNPYPSSFQALEALLRELRTGHVDDVLGGNARRMFFDRSSQPL